MRSPQRGFIISLFLIVTAFLLIGGYFYFTRDKNFEYKDTQGNMVLTAVYPAYLKEYANMIEASGFKCWDDANILKFVFERKGGTYISYATNKEEYLKDNDFLIKNYDGAFVKTYTGKQKFGNYEFDVFEGTNSERYYVLFSNDSMLEITDYYGWCGGKSVSRDTVMHILNSIKLNY